MKAKRYLVTSIIILFSFIIQTTLTHYMEINGIKPNIVLMVIICYALSKGSIVGATIGLITGIFADILSGKIFGLFTLTNFYTGMLAGFLYQKFFRESVLVTVVATFLLTLFYDLIFYFFRYYIWTESGLGFALKNIILPEALYNCIMIIAVRYIIKKLDKYMHEGTSGVRMY